MFTIREINYETDSGAVVQLLKKTFEGPFTPDFFKWKHIDNPAGPSYGLVALNDAGDIVGVRLFMWWQLKTEHGIKKAIRPVDTATDRAYRGKGVFKTLTLEGLKRLEGQYDFIFNTPNKKSLPGYLKMGWKVLPADYPYYLGFANLLSGKKSFKIHLFSDVTELKGIAQINQKYKSIDFLAWRYKNPNYKKALVTIDGVCNLLIYRVMGKNVRGVRIKFLVVVEYVGEGALLEKIICAVCKQENAVCYYFADFGNTGVLRSFPSLRRGKTVVAYRAAEPSTLLSIGFSTGDLEGVI